MPGLHRKSCLFEQRSPVVRGGDTLRKLLVALRGLAPVTQAEPNVPEEEEVRNIDHRAPVTTKNAADLAGSRLWIREVLETADTGDIVE